MRDLVPARTHRKRRPQIQELPDLPVAEEVMKEPEKSEEEE